MYVFTVQNIKKMKLFKKNFDFYHLQYHKKHFQTLIICEMTNVL